MVRAVTADRGKRDITHGSHPGFRGVRPAGCRETRKRTIEAAPAGRRQGNEGLVHPAAQRLREPASAVTDAIDRADNGVAARDEVLDAVGIIFEAAVVMKDVGSVLLGDLAQMRDDTRATAEIEDAARSAACGRWRCHHSDWRGGDIRAPANDAAIRNRSSSAGKLGLGLARARAGHDKRPLAFP